MKKLTLVSLLSVAAGASALAQTQFTITGSTAFRAISIDRAASLFDPASFTAVTNNASTGQITYSGTLSNAVPALGKSVVSIGLSFSGSVSGMNSVINATPVPIATFPTGTANAVPDIAFSDVFPSSATPPIPDSAVDRVVVGIAPFAFIKNNGVVGITNITQDQAVFLLVNSGPTLPQTFLGGANAAGLYFIGRDPGSGSRVTIEKDVKFIGTPTEWATNAANAYVITNGYSSGGLVRATIAAKSDSIGYLGLADAAAISANATILNYNGVVCSVTNVYKGSYTLWGYEHIVNRSGGLSATKALIRDALIAAINNPGFQSTNTLYTSGFGEVNKMEVERTSDGGPIASKLF